MLLYDWCWYVKSDVFFPQPKISQAPFVMVVRHTITDTLLRCRSTCLDNCAKFNKFAAHFLWCAGDVSIYIFYFFHAEDSPGRMRTGGILARPAAPRTLSSPPSASLRWEGL